MRRYDRIEQQTAKRKAKRALIESRWAGPKGRPHPPGGLERDSLLRSDSLANGVEDRPLPPLPPPIVAEEIAKMLRAPKQERLERSEKVMASAEAKGKTLREMWSTHPEIHPRWKGGRFVNKAGYVMIRVGGKYRLEHRVVMEALLGRALTKKETVHHLNGKRADNRAVNLELWASAHGPGHRVEMVKEEVRFCPIQLE